ncbi:MAG: hypothetical protein V1803_02425 [Candidatus Roizmanbacteria bacterium]
MNTRPSKIGLFVQSVIARLRSSVKKEIRKEAEKTDTAIKPTISSVHLPEEIDIYTIKALRALKFAADQNLDIEPLNKKNSPEG